MWHYQKQFLKGLKWDVNEIFHKLSKDLTPRILLLGILRKYVKGYDSISLEPENLEINPDDFGNIDEIAKKILTETPREETLYLSPHAYERYYEYLKKESLRKAIKHVIDEHYKNYDKISFISSSVMVYNYEVFVVLQFEKETYKRFNYFQRNTSGEEEQGKSGFQKTLLDSLIQVVLEKATEALYRPSPGKNLPVINIDSEEIMRIATASFFHNVIITASASRSGYNLFDICNYISSLKYEGASGIGKLLVTKEDHPAINISIRLKEPVRLSDYRKIRKLLEIASDNLYLYTDGDNIIGFAELQENYDLLSENLFIVNFFDFHKWELLDGDKSLILVEYNKVRLPVLKIEKSRFEYILKRTFPEISGEKMNILWDIVSAAIEQKHGTLIIISGNAEKESERLKNQSINIEPVGISDKELIKSISAIDGALLFDISGTCHAIGVILDGKATNTGDPARGARYNSAIKYIDMNKKDAVAVIISEDGMVDIYPDVKQEVKRSEIGRYLTNLRSPVSLTAIDFDPAASDMDYFYNYRHYLDKEISRKSTEIYEKHRKEK